MKTPCIKECTLVNDQCTGCHRTLHQIENWHRYSDNVREIALRIINERAKEALKRVTP